MTAKNAMVKNLLSVLSAVLFLSQLDAELYDVCLILILSCNNTHNTGPDTIEGGLCI